MLEKKDGAYWWENCIMQYISMVRVCSGSLVDVPGMRVSVYLLLIKNVYSAITAIFRDSSPD